MSNEPGLTLGRLMAAERNALAAIETTRINREHSDDLLKRISMLELEVVNLKQELSKATASFSRFYGGGPTARD